MFWWYCVSLSEIHLMFYEKHFELSWTCYLLYKWTCNLFRNRSAKPAHPSSLHVNAIQLVAEPFTSPETPAAAREAPMQLSVMCPVGCTGLCIFCGNSGQCPFWSKSVSWLAPPTKCHWRNPTRNCDTTVSFSLFCQRTTCGHHPFLFRWCHLFLFRRHTTFSQALVPSLMADVLRPPAVPVQVAHNLQTPHLSVLAAHNLRPPPILVLIAHNLWPPGVVVPVVHILRLPLLWLCFGLGDWCCQLLWSFPYVVIFILSYRIW